MKGHTVTSKPAAVMKNKQEADNQKRLMAIKENLKLKQAQQSIGLTALKDVDSKNLGQRIVFKDDSSDEDDKTGKDNLQKKLTLFDSEDEEEDTEDIFKSKPHMEGKKGEKLMRMEQKIGDPRFKLDARFALSDSEEEEGDYEDRNKPLTDIDKSLAEEKLASLKVLENVVGKTTLARFSEKLKRNVKHITDMNKLRFDPTKIQNSEAVSVDKKKISQPDKTVPPNHGNLVDVKATSVKKKTDNVKKPVDDVKKPTVNEVPALVNLFRKEETGSFSLLQQFGQQTDDEEMDSEDDNYIEGGDKCSGPLSGLFKEQSRKADLEQHKKTPAKSEPLSYEGVSLFKPQAKKVHTDSDKVGPTKSGPVHSEDEIDSSSSDAEGMTSDDGHLEKDDRLQLTTDNDIVDEDLINAGRVDIRFTKEQWLERWTEIRPVLVTLYKRKHKEAMKNKRRHDEFTRKKEFLKRSRKNRFRK
ncbi:unnamed protein product [Candidula unifasciata]|uniref:Nucleolar protein 8 n=1 Tax=Candidula unifasciata TaxID=100452 RepID=A0A8S4A7U1_9EUPU|nr:unnamed protein product [Candidula unifasciata]